MTQRIIDFKTGRPIQGSETDAADKADLSHVGVLNILAYVNALNNKGWIQNVAITGVVVNPENGRQSTLYLWTISDMEKYGSAMVGALDLTKQRIINLLLEDDEEGEL